MGSNSPVYDSIVTKEATIGRNFNVAGRTGRPAYFFANVDAKMGGWFNASKSQLHFGSAGTGEVTELASAFNAELYLPNKTMTSGSYSVYEGNLNFQASTIVVSNAAIPCGFMTFNLGGTQAKIDTWEESASACLFNIGGATAANDKFFDTQGGATHSASIRCIIGGTAYWLMLAADPGA